MALKDRPRHSLLKLGSGSVTSALSTLCSSSSLPTRISASGPTTPFSAPCRGRFGPSLPASILIIIYDSLASSAERQPLGDLWTQTAQCHTFSYGNHYSAIE